MVLNLVKLCVGCNSVDELLAWRRETRVAGAPWILRTRQTPRRASELLDGGSLYRVYSGFILSRQRIISVRTVTEGPTRRCEITLDETVVLTEPMPRRAFQGWRYLASTEAPSDLTGPDAEVFPTIELARKLRNLGAW